ncbi:probable caffeine synthase MTL2 [Arachis hypogaea]|uniref:probable caffeine synthase MTL2 n=1 Tax=Arachis hypogaea TaxID=3818 RepID=UPI000DEC9A12|nr:3,7-dimethylxanthine N-methyltransferase-like [Arachis hypogaea]XP_025634833.1 3,7-dimethylxanthine N-methyltransferase-like [Arachis hypogaea]XP_025662179.1 3,7-dimethylxanthine N-methyltransferase-like [Arachis hypogaea]XP_025662182.1 3,7-dimethylxanthine N-methyltransferase-like [Arachis hypogaea]QHO25874.1 Theobromine synthase [Arachis hypogaea]
MATRSKFIHTKGGVGETSYANNSSLQSNLMSKVKPMLEESIRSLYSSSLPSCLKVADLGCSSGPNALKLVSGIIDIVDSISCNLDNHDHEPLAFQFFLNDQFRNDFNNIFESLPQFYERLMEEKGERLGSCLVNATPGSFYGRLFPNNSIHLFHSSASLHWLSQTPRRLAKGTGLVNKGNIYITRTSPPEVYQAYLDQFQHDFSAFLRSRAKELVQGGGMFLMFLGRDQNSEMISPYEVLGSALNDMVSEGLIEEAKLDSMNMPRYGGTPDEVIQVIESEGSFTLQKLEAINNPWDGGLNNNNGNDNADMSADFIAKHVRATCEPMLNAEFGEGIIDELFLRYRKRIVMKLEEEKLEYTMLVMFMTKK